MYTLIVPPSSEPISVAELKSVLRVTHDTDDQLIADMARTARTFIERRLDVALLSQSWTLTLPCHPDAPIPLRPNRVSQILSVKARYGDNELVEVSADDWRLLSYDPALLSLSIPSSNGSDALTEIEVTFEAGAQDASDISDDILRALYLLTAHYYQEREVFRQQRYIPVPVGVEALFQAYHEVRL